MSMMSGAIMYIMSMIPWTAIFILTRPLGLYLYVLREKESCTNIQKKVQNQCSTLLDGGKGNGYAIGYWFFLYLQSSEFDSMNATLICTKATYERLIADDDDDDDRIEQILPRIESIESEEKIGLLERYGTPKHYYYRKRDFTLDKEERPEQTAILDQLERDLKRQSYQCILLHGKQGTGKSMLGLFLARRLKGTFCNTMNPFEAGDTLANVHSQADTTKKNPLILMFDEIDVYLKKIAVGIPAHKNLDIMIKDKASWNRMLDSIQRGMFKNLILILTTNETPDSIRSIDPSYIRLPRVNRIVELKDVVFPEGDEAAEKIDAPSPP
jgi:hypothetical protein